MYDVVVCHMDNAGLMDEVGILFFWTRVIFLLISCPPYSYCCLYRHGWNMKGDETIFVSR